MSAKWPMGNQKQMSAGQPTQTQAERQLRQWAKEALRLWAAEETHIHKGLGVKFMNNQKGLESTYTRAHTQGEQNMTDESRKYKRKQETGNSSTKIHIHYTRS